MEDLEVFTLTGIIRITVAGTIHGILMAAGVVIHTMEAITEADTMEAATMEADIGAADTTAAVIGAAELLITANVFTESNTTTDQADRMQQIMEEEVQRWVLRL